MGCLSSKEASPQAPKGDQAKADAKDAQSVSNAAAGKAPAGPASTGQSTGKETQKKDAQSASAGGGASGLSGQAASSGPGAGATNVSSPSVQVPSLNLPGGVLAHSAHDGRVPCSVLPPGVTARSFVKASRLIDLPLLDPPKHQQEADRLEKQIGSSPATSVTPDGRRSSGGRAAAGAAGGEAADALARSKNRRHQNKLAFVARARLAPAPALAGRPPDSPRPARFATPHARPQAADVASAADVLLLPSHDYPAAGSPGGASLTGAPGSVDRDTAAGSEAGWLSSTAGPGSDLPTPPL